MILYHGTHIRNLQQLRPFATQGNAISKPVICFTPNPQIALLYIANRPYRWVTFHEDENGKAVFTEHYENMLYDFYHTVSGSIYLCDGDNPSISPSHMKGVFTSRTCVPIEKEILIDNGYEEILKQEALGTIRVRRYRLLPSDEKNEIFKATVRAIHMQKLLLPSEDAPNKELVCFVRQHFPQAWETASKMTRAEIDQMLREWRASL